MKILTLVAVISASVASASIAHAQEVAQPVVATTAAPVAVIAQPSLNVLKSGAPIKLRTLDTLTSRKKKSKVGDRFSLEVSEAVLANGVVVIPAGSTAVGEVTMMKNKGMWGKRGRLSGRVISLRLGERQIRLSGTFDDAGSAGTAGVVGAAVILPIAGFFVTGTSADIPAGTIVNAFLDEDISFTPPTGQ